MGKLIVVKSGLLATIQDKGRFGYRQYGIPQSGAMDRKAMHLANELIGNESNLPVIEVAMQGIQLEAMEATIVAVTGAKGVVQINGQTVEMNVSYKLAAYDKLTVKPPGHGVYSYVGIGGKIKARKDFESYSTYLMAGFGGLDGKSLQKGDVITSEGNPPFERRAVKTEREISSPEIIHLMRGPEWGVLKDAPDRKTFEIEASSNRMGIRLAGDLLEIDGQEIKSSAVIPGTVQLPAGGSPIILMNDCQTTGGYPRIGKVIDEDLGRLAQLKPGTRLKFEMVLHGDVLDQN